jgi:hypothetical protein
MDRENCSSLTEFIFIGITNNPERKGPLFAVFLLVYLINLMGNLGMIILIRLDSQLHTPMYFFLSHLSFCDLCYSTAIGPKMLMDIFGKNKSIPFLRLCSTILHLLYLCRCWVCTAGSDGFWSVQGHKQPLALYSPHVQQGVCPACGWGLHGGNGRCFDTYNAGFPLMFLWI